jgi:hypothetical protein
MVVIVMKYCVVRLQKQFVECTVRSTSMRLKMKEVDLISRSVKPNRWSMWCS